MTLASAGRAEPVLVRDEPNEDLATFWAELARRITAGNADAEAEFAGHFHARVRVFATARLHGSDAALDIAQETIVAVLQALRTGQVHEPGKLRKQTRRREVGAIPTAANVNRLAAWSADGRFLLYGAGGPRVADTTTGESWPLTAAPLGGDWYGASWAPDGSFIVLDIGPAPRNEFRQWQNVTYDVITQAARGQVKGHRPSAVKKCSKEVRQRPRRTAHAAGGLLIHSHAGRTSTTRFPTAMRSR